MGHPGKIATHRISTRLRELRTARGWTQVELAQKLGLSQSRLSSIERGVLSLSAEEFLEVLQLFNVPASEFAASQARGTATDQLQNALERLGARHLRENADLLPSERLKQVNDVIREVMIDVSSPRHITALAPVLVSNLDHVSYLGLLAEFQELRIAHRLGWLADNVLAALVNEVGKGADSTSWRRETAVAMMTFELWLQHDQVPERPDIFDRSIRSEKSLQNALATISPISKRWNVVTSIELADFSAALRASRVALR